MNRAIQVLGMFSERQAENRRLAQERPKEPWTDQEDGQEVMTSNDKGTQKLTRSDVNFLAMLWKSGATFEQGVTLPSGLSMTAAEIDRFTCNEGWK